MLPDSYHTLYSHTHTCKNMIFCCCFDFSIEVALDTVHITVIECLTETRRMDLFCFMAQGIGFIAVSWWGGTWWLGALWWRRWQWLCHIGSQKQRQSVSGISYELYLLLSYNLLPSARSYCPWFHNVLNMISNRGPNISDEWALGGDFTSKTQTKEILLWVKWEMFPHRLTHVNTWPPAGGAV